VLLAVKNERIGNEWEMNFIKRNFFKFLRYQPKIWNMTFEFRFMALNFSQF